MANLVRPRPGGVPPDLGLPRLPGSKSHTQRAMILAAFTPGRWEITGALRSDDTEVLATALVACGAALEWSGATLVVSGRGPGALAADLDLGENGTALRMLLMVVPMLGGRLRVDGAPGLRRRPVQPALLALHAAGARVSGEVLPLRVDGSTMAGELPPLAADLTTQVASGALLGLALRGLATPGGAAALRVRGAVAAGYLRVTAAVLQAFGWSVEITASAAAPDLWTLRVGGGPHAGGEVVIPPDASARAFPIALGALHRRNGGAVLPASAADPHPDWGIDADLAALASGPGDLELTDLAARPDCAPAVAAVAACRPGRTLLRHLRVLRAKESDRLQALAEGLQSAGATCRVVGDDLEVRGPLPAVPATPRRLATVPDHRIVMALALLGTVLPGGAVVEHADTVGKSWPGFWDWLGRVAVVGPAP